MSDKTRSFYNKQTSPVSATQAGGSAYQRGLLSRRIDLVRENCSGGLVVDLCCAEGRHLRMLRGEFEVGIGIDFAETLLHRAREESAGDGKICFACGDATTLPVNSSSAALVYSISSLYLIENMESVVSEIARILRPGGRCVLDLGCRPTLNQIVLCHYPKNPTNYPLRAAEIEPMLTRNRLRLVSRHCFQILPMWGNRPRWLRPLLHPIWHRIMAMRLGARMLDEVISSLPLVRNLAFRHVVVAERIV